MVGRRRSPLPPQRGSARAFSPRAAAPRPGRARRPPSHATGGGAVFRARSRGRPRPPARQRGHRIGHASAEFVGRRAPAPCSHLRARHLVAGLYRRRRGHLGLGGGERLRIRQSVARRLVACAGQRAPLPVPAPPLVFPRLHLDALSLADVTHRAQARPDPSRPRRRAGIPRQCRLRVHAGARRARGPARGPDRRSHLL